MMGRKELLEEVEAEWRDRLVREVSSGKNIAAFCRSEGVTESAFYGWRSRLGLKHANHEEQDAAIKMPLPFIDIGPVKRVAKSNDSSTVDKNDLNTEQLSSLELRLELGNGVVLQITRR